MRLFALPVAVWALTSVVQSAALQPRNLLDDLQKQAMEALKEAESNGTLAKKSCSLSNASVRRDW